MADAHAKEHDYHLVEPSPWPAVGSLGAFVLAVGTILYFISRKDGDPQLLYVLPGMALVIFTMFGWWRDVIREAETEGCHTPVVQIHLRYGMIDHGSVSLRIVQAGCIGGLRGICRGGRCLSGAAHDPRQSGGLVPVVCGQPLQEVLLKALHVFGPHALRQSKRQRPILLEPTRIEGRKLRIPTEEKSHSLEDFSAGSGPFLRPGLSFGHHPTPQ